jgi:hypothetical protein
VQNTNTDAAFPRWLTRSNHTWMASALAAMFLAGEVAGQPSEIWFGTWSLNLAKSTYQAGATPKSIVQKIEPWGDGVKLTTDAVTSSGARAHIEWIGKFDGKDYPMQGNPDSDTSAYRRIDDHTYEILPKRDGKRTVTTIVSVSNDGKTRTMKTTGKDSKGQPVENVAVYDRQ